MKRRHLSKSRLPVINTKLRIVFGVCFTFAAVVILNSAPLFIAQRIECYTQFGACPADYLSQVEWLKGRRMFSKLPAAQIKKQLNVFPEIQSVSLFRRLPSTLIVSMTLRKPLGVLGPDVLGAQVISDDSGRIYKQIDNSSLPWLYSPELLGINTAINPNQLKALKIMENLSSLSDYRLTANLIGTSLSVNFLPNLEVIVDINRPLDDWYPSLQLILTRSKITAKMPRKIDLRFDNSVIVN